MSQIGAIPIKNIFHILLYAWNKIWETNLLSVQELDSCSNIEELLAKIFINSVKPVLKRGLDRGYTENTEFMKILKGRVNFGRSLDSKAKRNLALECEFDNFEYDVLQNQILKSTIDNLLNSAKKTLDNSIKAELESLSLKFKQISNIKLSDSHFKTIQLNRNNASYKILLDVCRLINRNMLVSEQSGAVQFLDFTQNQKQMHSLFEEFLRKFYKIRQNKFKVRTQKLWLNDRPAEIMPEMQTDLILESEDRVLIVDAKFYQDIFQTSRFGKKTIRNAHLNQLHTYLSAYEHSFKFKPEGLIIYAAGKDSVCHFESVLGFKHSYQSIDLSQDWKKIEFDLLNFLN